MRVQRVHLHKVGPFEDAVIEFSRGSDPALADAYLLTGPNGSGKSTVLYALAAAIRAHNPQLGPDLVAPRLRDPDESFVAIDCESYRYGVAAIDAQGRGQLDRVGPFDGVPLPRRSVEGQVAYYTSGEIGNGYGHRAANHPPVGRAAKRFEWAAFAYAGARTMDSVHVSAIEEPRGNPFQNALSFTQTADTSALVHWIASQQFKELKARHANDEQKADSIRQSIHEIEQITGDIIGDDTFAFVGSVDDNNVRVRHHGKVVDVGLLPDGLKAILSWVADLLMRLDRISWVDDTSSTRRSFLLLLDEVEVHLHPAWQRRVLPTVQKLFPNAQIIASTHSPFVVMSADDARVIELGVENGVASVRRNLPSRVGRSYGAVLGDVFGVTSEFDIDTEQLFQRFRESKARLLRGDGSARAELDEIITELSQRSDELREVAGFEKRQLERQLARVAP